MIKTGDQLPDFILKDQKGKIVNSADYRGKNILLSFHPLAFTSVCAEQMKSIEANYDRFESLNTVPFGLSIDTTFSKKIWAESLGISKLRLISDFWPHGGYSINLGIFRGNEGFSERANIIADSLGIVKFIKIYEIPQLPDINEIISFLEKEINA